MSDKRVESGENQSSRFITYIIFIVVIIAEYVYLEYDNLASGINYSDNEIVRNVRSLGNISADVTVEDLMYKYKSDKSRDDHGYSKLYQMLFSPIRDTVTNITEVGIATGQSIQAWYRYFPNAEIHAFDKHWIHDKIRNNLEYLKPRVHAHIVDILVNDGARILSEDLGFVPESMDIIIDDGPHTVPSQEGFIAKLFPYLKPSGFYIIEDIGYAQQGLEYFHENPSKLNNVTRDIIESNDAIWVDTALGHRAWDEWVKRVGGMWARNRTHHNSFCLVIQKRKKPLRQPMQMNYKNGAMEVDGIVEENSDED